MAAVRHGRSSETARSRDVLLDVAERLMSERGYAGTSVSAICQAAGVAATSLYWHFGSKEGLLATVMERGAERWFAALPRWSEPSGEPGDPEHGARRAEAILRSGADAVAANPVFLRLAYLLALEGTRDEVAAELVQRVRRHAAAYFRGAIPVILAGELGPDVPPAALDELVRFALAYSDGCFFAVQLEPDRARLRQMYADLATALRALAPVAISRARTS